jgi:multicomponent Na+:H+ antiporter subunit E
MGTRTLFLAVVWCALTRELSLANLLLGLGLGAVAELLPGGRGRRRFRLTLAPQWIGLGLYFVLELTLASLRVLRDVAGPPGRIRSVALAIPLEAASEEEAVLLSNLVTMTPGTLALDVSQDLRTLHVHVMTSGDPEEVRRNIQQGFGRRVRRLFS